MGSEGKGVGRRSERAMFGGALLVAAVLGFTLSGRMFDKGPSSAVQQQPTDVASQILSPPSKSKEEDLLEPLKTELQEAENSHTTAITAAKIEAARLEAERVKTEERRAAIQTAVEGTGGPTKAPMPKPTEAPTPKPTEAPTPKPTEAAKPEAPHAPPAQQAGGTKATLVGSVTSPADPIPLTRRPYQLTLPLRVHGFQRRRGSRSTWRRPFLVRMRSPQA
jgi:hypothetical protein